MHFFTHTKLTDLRLYMIASRRHLISSVIVPRKSYCYDYLATTSCTLDMDVLYNIADANPSRSASMIWTSWYWTNCALSLFRKYCKHANDFMLHGLDTAVYTTTNSNSSVFRKHTYYAVSLLSDTAFVCSNYSSRLPGQFPTPPAT